MAIRTPDAESNQGSPATPASRARPMPWPATYRERVMRPVSAARDDDGRQLTPTARRVYDVLWTCLERDGDTCDAAMTFIAARAGCHERTVTRAIKQLERLGIIKRLVTPGPAAIRTRERSKYQFLERRLAPTRPAWRTGPTRAEKRRELREKAERAKRRSGDLQGLLNAKGLPPVIGRILQSVAVSLMDGSPSSLAAVPAERGAAPPAPSASAERRGSPPAESPPGSLIEQARQFRAFLKTRGSGGGGPPPDSPPADPNRT